MNIQPMNRLPRSQNFGMALHIPSSLYLSRVIGDAPAQQVERVVPELKKIAEDVDVFVDVYHDYRFQENPTFVNRSEGLEVKVLDLAEKIEEPITRFYAQHDWIDRPNIIRRTKIITPSIDLGSNLLETTNMAKREFHAIA